MSITIGDALLKLGADTKDLDAAMAKVGDSIKRGTEKWSKQLRVAGAAFIAVGVAGLKLADDARKMNAQLSQSAITLGVTTGEMRELALETTNVTFKLDSVIKTFDILAKAGVRNTEEMKATASAFDALADATGSAAEAMADKLIPAFKVFGIELPSVAEDLDKFTWLTKNTMVTLEEFAAAMDYVAAYGSSLDLTIEEMIASMAALEEKGITGSAVTRVFRTAITQAASGTMTMNEALEITQESVDKYMVAMEGAVGVTQEYADAANEQFGIMDKIKQKFDELKLRVGSLLMPFEALLAVMAALGPTMLFLSTAAGRATVSFIALKASMLGILGLAAGAGYGGYRLGDWIADMLGLGAYSGVTVEMTEYANQLLLTKAAAQGFIGTVDESADFLREQAMATEEVVEVTEDLIDVEKREIEIARERTQRAYILKEAYDEMIRTAQVASQQALSQRAVNIMGQASDVMQQYAQHILDSGKAATVAAKQLGKYIMAVATAQAVQTLTNDALQEYIESVIEFGVDSEEATKGLLDYVEAFALGAEMAERMEEALRSLEPWIGIADGAGAGIGGGGGQPWWMHGGGIVPGIPGSNQLVMAQAGERITPAGETNNFDSHAQITVNAVVRGERDIRELARQLDELAMQDSRSKGLIWK